ncbi:hypothetical protein [Hydrogenophaga borbori]|uniref:hypothetical protein n=1 Tax=Hydrogenophaga borbori TaxID=2294117 RepID=UPI00301CE260
MSKETRLTYERSFSQLRAGWDMGLARKKTHYVMRAAGLYCMRKELRQLLRESKKILKNGITGSESHTDRAKLYGEKIAQAAKLLRRIEDFKGLAWGNISDKQAHFHERSHKKKAATDEQLKKFYEAAKRSQFHDAFQLIEFTGARPQELEKGIRVELVKRNDSLALRCTIEGVKCDGKKKGLDIRSVEIPFPQHASIDIKRRWHDLAHKAKSGLVVRVDKTEKQTAGQRITNAFKTTSKTAGVDVAAYSLRHRFSAQAKQSNKGDAIAVALALGHQTTKTQEHYGRAKRGGADVSPVQVVGIDLDIAQIRGATTKAGPPTHIREHSAFSKVVKSTSTPPPKPKPKGMRL